MGLLLDVDPRSGAFVNTRHRDLAEIVNDYNPNLFVLWIPPAERSTPEDKRYPFAIVDLTNRADPYLVFKIEEAAMDQQVLAALFERDITKQGGADKMLAKIQAGNAAAKVMQAKQHAEEVQEMKDVHISILKSPLHTYKHNGKVYE